MYKLLNSFIPHQNDPSGRRDRGMKEDTGVSAREQKEWLGVAALSDPHSAGLHLR
jgi:hypothetical protein